MVTELTPFLNTLLWILAAVVLVGLFKGVAR